MAGPALVVPAVKKHTATVIMAHGLGDSGGGWVGLAENWRRRGKFEDVKFIFPNAPSIPITVNMGASMPGWYDITTFDELQTDAHDEAGILRSRSVFNDLVAAEMSAGIPSDRIVLGGFSQGGAMSLFTGLTSPHRLAGIFGLSCYLLLGNKVKSLAAENGNANRDSRWFMGHGDADPLVKYEWGVKTAEVLKKDLGVTDLEFKTYHGLPHAADPLEMDHVEAFIRKCLSPVSEGGAGAGAGSKKGEL
ncbi:hypothetical protein GJ744_001563 [Endocarpon pusillum]|uniref:Acyl-protein thioesterase 1 n=1 Tax=Endocarpon pusillum TaxID=364733 RepID=A0A8H7AD42_9EURO|nr:hypothetical protein GJ744_001563 [Endocarpon pusillum]